MQDQDSALIVRERRNKIDNSFKVWPVYEKEMAKTMYPHMGESAIGRLYAKAKEPV